MVASLFSHIQSIGLLIAKQLSRQSYYVFCGKEFHISAVVCNLAKYGNQ